MLRIKKFSLKNIASSDYLEISYILLIKIFGSIDEIHFYPPNIGLYFVYNLQFMEEMLTKQYKVVSSHINLNLPNFALTSSTVLLIKNRPWNFVEVHIDSYLDYTNNYFLSSYFLLQYAFGKSIIAIRYSFVSFSRIDAWNILSHWYSRHINIELNGTLLILN